MPIFDKAAAAAVTENIQRGKLERERGKRGVVGLVMRPESATAVSLLARRTDGSQTATTTTTTMTTTTTVVGQEVDHYRGLESTQSINPPTDGREKGLKKVQGDMTRMVVE